jgi:adenine/guanine phosphoribosyltransferase-like PRPP-binding protein
LRNHIRTVPDWPMPGIQFRDITPLLQDAKVFRVLIDAFVHRYMGQALQCSTVQAAKSFRTLMKSRTWQRIWQNYVMA